MEEIRKKILAGCWTLIIIGLIALIIGLLLKSYAEDEAEEILENTDYMISDEKIKENQDNLNKLAEYHYWSPIIISSGISFMGVGIIFIQGVAPTKCKVDLIPSYYPMETLQK